MGQINAAFNKVSACDPSFIKAYVSSAKKFNILPNSNTDSQKGNDDQKFEFMKKTYRVSLNSIQGN